MTIFFNSAVKGFKQFLGAVPINPQTLTDDFFWFVENNPALLAAYLALTGKTKNQQIAVKLRDHFHLETTDVVRKALRNILMKTYHEFQVPPPPLPLTPQATKPAVSPSTSQATKPTVSPSTPQGTGSAVTDGVSP
jgi:hypothetical protein